MRIINNFLNKAVVDIHFFKGKKIKKLYYIRKLNNNMNMKKKYKEKFQICPRIL